jgi:hypothetical protein
MKIQWNYSSYLNLKMQLGISTKIQWIYSSYLNLEMYVARHILLKGGASMGTSQMEATLGCKI